MRRLSPQEAPQPGPEGRRKGGGVERPGGGAGAGAGRGVGAGPRRPTAEALVRVNPPAHHPPGRCPPGPQPENLPRGTRVQPLGVGGRRERTEKKEEGRRVFVCAFIPSS